MRSATTLSPSWRLSTRKFAESMPQAKPPIGWMKVVAQSVSTPRSKTTTGLPVSQARSTAGVRAAVELGEMMNASQPPSAMK